MTPTADVAVIGGSGFYRFVAGGTEVAVDTPYGAPSDPVVIAEVSGRRVAFLARHGKDHRLPPHRIPYRANLWALRSLGVREILAPSAVGSLRPELRPGSLVVPDQLVDRTSGRTSTYYDAGAVHVSFADPYCPRGRAAVVGESARTGWPAADGGTLVVIEGPRFSTRAESRSYAAAGWSVVNMTGSPEAVLARELALCYTAVALVTDFDAGVEAGTGVTQDEVFRVFAASTDRLRELLVRVLAAMPERAGCPCPHALDGIAVPVELP